MQTSTLHRYYIPSENGEGWAYIVIDTEIGYFSTVSDWGNYAFRWTHPGMEFRKFLTKVSPDYFQEKITLGGESRVWDSDQVQKNIRLRLQELVAEGTASQEQVDEAIEDLDSDLRSMDGVYLWLSGTTPDIHDNFNSHEGIYAEMPEQQSMAFCLKVLPKFQEILRKELREEHGNSKVEKEV